MSTAIKNPSIYSPGHNITAEATAPVLGRRFVQITGSRTTKGNLAVATAAEAGRVCGVAGHDADTDELVQVVRGNSRVVWVSADGAIAAGAEVQVGTGGTATTLADGPPVGYAVTAADDGNDAEISLY